ncbi:MAG: MlaA family lipoprotein [Alphaproteobacteria bacterium]
MNLTVSRYATIAGLILCIFAAGSAGTALAAVSADIQKRIQTTAETWRANAERQKRMQQFSGDPHLSAVSQSLNRQVSASMIAQAVMDSINRDPSTAGEATSLALQAAPELSTEIRSNLSIAFLRMALTYAPRAPPVAVRAPAPYQQAAVPKRTETPKPHTDPSEADAVADEVIGESLADRDPLEDLNRAIFSFNDFLDSYIMVPIAKTYRFIMPEFVREMGRNFFENFNESVVAINDVLQGDFENAGISLGRFVVNSTAGVFGFFEVAERIDLKEHPADFGQTLHSYGVESGPYVMLPFFGPSTARDAIGKGVDSFLNPISYFLEFETRLYMKASETLVDREAVLDELAELRKGSVDYYAAVRSAWFQNRARELRKGAPPPAEDIDKLFADVK